MEPESKALWKAPDRQLERVRNALEVRHGTHKHWPAFDTRLRAHVLDLRDELSNLYGIRGDFEPFLVELLDVAFKAWVERPDDLKARDAVL